LDGAPAQAWKLPIIEASTCSRVEKFVEKMASVCRRG